MRINLNSFLSVLIIVAAFFIGGCGENGEQAFSGNQNTQVAAEETVAKVLGEVWEGLNANNQEAYNALGNKTVELIIAIINPEIQLQPTKTSSAEKIAIEAFTVLESISLAGPQKIFLMMTPEEVAAMKYDKGAPVVWGTIAGTVNIALHNKSLVFGLAQEASTINLTKDEIWTIPLEVWEKQMRNQMTQLLLAFSAYDIDHWKKPPESIDALFEYGYRNNLAIKVEFTPNKKSNGESSFIAVAFSPDGKYQMTVDFSMDATSQMKAVPVE